MRTHQAKMTDITMCQILDTFSIKSGPLVHWENVDTSMYSFVSAKVETDFCFLWFHLQSWKNDSPDLWIMSLSQKQLEEQINITLSSRGWLHKNSLVCLTNLRGIEDLSSRWTFMGSLDEIAFSSIFSPSEALNITPGLY